MSIEHDKDKFFLKLLGEYIGYKFWTLLYISSIMAALLVIGSFGGNLFPLNNIVRFIISALLILIVFSLSVYFGEINRGLENIMKELGTPVPSLGIWSSIKFVLFADENGKKDNRKFKERFATQWPGWAIWFLWIIVLFLIFLIWTNTEIGKNGNFKIKLLNIWNMFF